MAGKPKPLFSFAFAGGQGYVLTQFVVIQQFRRITKSIKKHDKGKGFGEDKVQYHCAAQERKRP